MTTELHFLTIGEASVLLESGQISPVELTRAFLDRIDSLDDALKCYITILHDDAMADARQAEAEILRGDYRGPMHGIPIALKDLYDTAGIRTTAGSKVMADRVPTEDATTTARLKAAGAVLLGKLAMHEFALGGPDETNGFPSRATHGTSTTSPAAPAAARARASQPGSAWERSAPAPAAPSGDLLHFAASPASRQPTGASAAMVSCPSVGRSITAAL